MLRMFETRTGALGIGIALICAVVSVGQHLAAAEAPSRPNVVFILTDDQRWDAMSCMDHPFLKTPDMDRFPALRLGYEVARAGGTAGAVFNAANEAAVEAFRQGRIPFGRIVALIEQVLERHTVQTNPTLESLLAADAWARHEVSECMSH